MTDPTRGDLDRCMNCHRPITFDTFQGMGFWEPDIDRDPLSWRHDTNGYAACRFGMTSGFATPGWPEVVCLCGSTRFYEAFQQANYDLTMAGKIVLSVGFYPHSKTESGHGEGVGHDSAEKVALDELHKRKIDLADSVLVLNIDGYVGSSTRSEIDYAVKLNKPVAYLEDAKAVAS